MAVRAFPFASLPKVARASVEAGRRLLAHLPLRPGADWPEACRALGGEVAIELSAVSALPGRALADEPRGPSLRLDGGPGRRALVVIDPALAPRLARRALGLGGDELPAARPLTAAEEGALEFLIGALCERGTVRTDGWVREGDRALPVAAESQVWRLDARLRTPVGDGWARLYAPEWLRLVVPPPATLPIGPRLAAARIELRVVAGHPRLTRAELAGLAAGDVVLLGDDRIRLRAGSSGFPAHMDGEALVIDEPFRRETSMGDEANELLGELPIEVGCELGRVTMSGRELAQLRPGAVVPVGRPLAGPVDLTVGGRVVARGELVDVEGELGVRVTQVTE
jgi:type III secretion system YscQ/HrcQ family protein